MNEQFERPSGIKCNDCGRELSSVGVTAMSSHRLGEYYRGPQICDDCASTRREEARQQHEAANR